MPFREVLVPWTEQPQEVTPAASDFNLAGLYHPAGYDAVTGRIAESITATREATRAGIALRFASGSEVARYAPILVGAAEYSTLTVLIPNFASSSNTRQGIWHVQATSGSVQNRLRLIWLDAANGFYLDTNGGYAYRCTPTFSAGDLLVIGFTKGTGAATAQFYINGAPITTTQVAFVADTGTPAAAAPMWLGDDVESASGRRLNGRIALHSHSLARFSASTMRELATSPWQLFAPRAQRIFAPITVGGAYSITAQAGSYALTGQSSTITRSRLLTASAGSYAYTGQQATVSRNRQLTASAGAYALAGQSATLTKSRLIVASAGAYTYTGQSATLTYVGSAVNYSLTALAGSYALSGQSATLTKSRVINASAGSYSLTGRPATITYSGAPAPGGLSGVYFDVLSGRLLVLRSGI